MLYYFHIQKNHPFFKDLTDHHAAEQTIAERDQVTHLGWLSMSTLGAGRTMLSPVYPGSFLGHHSHLPPPYSGISKAPGFQAKLAASPPLQGLSVLPISTPSPTAAGQGSHHLGCSSKGSRPTLSSPDSHSPTSPRYSRSILQGSVLSSHALSPN